MDPSEAVSREARLMVRKALLAEEKGVTKARDLIGGERNRPRLAKVEKGYVFTGPRVGLGLPGLFESRRRLIVRHFMFAPDAAGAEP